jgi:hypothetical protein
MTINIANETRTNEDQADTAGFGIGVPQQPQQALIIVVCATAGLLPTAPQLITVRKAGERPLEY